MPCTAQPELDPSIACPASFASPNLLRALAEPSSGWMDSTHVSIQAAQCATNAFIATVFGWSMPPDGCTTALQVGWSMRAVGFATF
jgi:hypothetical protein